ncbi:MAG: rubrerythrin family protein [Haloferacaceae archaeon]
MDGPTFRDALVEAKAEELARLESPDLVDALTDGERDAPSVLRAAAHSERAARETFRAWADDETDTDARDAFVAVAEQEADHFRRVRAAFDGAFDPADAGPMHTYLRGREDTVERVAGGMVARPAVSLRTHARLIAFFEGRDETARAGLFRDLRAETAAVVDDGLTLLDERCTDADWERARMVGEYVVQVAYDDFADALAAQ